VTLPFHSIPSTTAFRTFPGNRQARVDMPEEGDTGQVFFIAEVRRRYDADRFGGDTGVYEAGSMD